MQMRVQRFQAFPPGIQSHKLTTRSEPGAAATPSNCTRNSVLRRRAASCSLPPPLLLSNESISSMKMIEGACKSAMQSVVPTGCAVRGPGQAYI
eukprot:1155987-Pelagomonas_calceolata.AAC.8